MSRIVKSILHHWLLISLTFATVKCCAQTSLNEITAQQFRALHWTVADGLSRDGMNVMIKDANRFMWVGSHYGGLSRFDGARFKKYPPKANSRNTTPSDRIISFAEDSLKNIWIGTEAGISRYDIRADTFTNFAPDDPTAPSKSIIPFWALNNELYCLESKFRIVVYNTQTLLKEEISTLGHSEKIRHNCIILDSVTNSIWLLNYDSAKGNGLIQISLHDRTRKYYSWPCFRKINNHDHWSEAMRLDRKRNCIWINSPDGLLKFSMESKIFTLAPAFSQLIKLTQYERWVGIDIDIYGNLWLATKPGGILIYNPESGNLRSVFAEQALQKKTGDANLHIYCDREGISWTSNWDNFGIYAILPHNPYFDQFGAKKESKDSLSNASIHSIIPISKNEIWIGTHDGLNIFDIATKKFSTKRQEHFKGLKGNFIVPVYVDTVRQKAWIRASESTSNYFQMALYEMDMKTGHSTPIDVRAGTIKVNSTATASKWFWPYKRGLMFFDENLGIFQIKENSVFAELIVPVKSVVSKMVLANEQFIFLNSIGQNVNHTYELKNGHWNKIAHVFDSLSWTSVFYNKNDKSYWVGIKYEFIHFDRNFKIIKTYRQEEGYNALAFSIVEDNQGNIWFSDELNLINRLDTALGIITTISTNEGFKKQNLDIHGPAVKDQHGDLYFGGINADNEDGVLYRIYPEKFLSQATSSVYLRSFKIDQEPLAFLKSINDVQNIKLNYNQNTISVETGIIDYYASGKGYLRYKLERNSKSEAWQIVPAYFNIRYEGLQPGNYKLIMQSSNVNNAFNSPVKILSIHISPPFWQTWWFRILSGLAVIITLYLIMQNRSRKLRLRNVQLEENVRLRTTELNQSLKDLKATQAQLIQSEKMASLGELTAGIAHEIQNPLNFVNNFSEVNAELLDEFQEEKEKGNEKVAANILKDIKDNNEKINLYGKRAGTIVKGMLEHSRTSKGVMELADINEMCDEYLMIAYHANQAKNNNIEISVSKFPDPTMGTIKVITQEIGKVLLNLYNNAFYSVAEKAKMTSADYRPNVSFTTVREGNKASIIIRDNGLGIPDKIKDKIFQPFYTTKPAGQGTGLGLSLSYDIIKAYGGELKCISTEGEGATFIIEIRDK